MSYKFEDSFRGGPSWSCSKSVHLVGFIIKKFVTMDGHMEVKNAVISLLIRNADTVRKGKDVSAYTVMAYGE